MNARTCKATLVLILLVRLVLTPVQAAKVNQIGSDAEFESLWNQVTELKNPSTRVLLRLRLLNSPAKKTIPAATFLEVLSDLCVNQDEIDPIASSWLYTGLLDVLKRKQPSDPKTIEVCQLKNWEQQRSARALNDGIRMLSDPQTIKEGTQLAKEALLSREISAEAILGQLIRVQLTARAVLPELLDTTLRLEEERPGTIPLRVLPFFTRFYLDKSIPDEMVTRYMVAAVRATRVSGEDLAQIPIRGSVLTLLHGIQFRAQTAAADLYSEIMSRLSSMERPSTRKEEMNAAEDRIQRATDRLDQTIREAKATTVPLFRKQLYYQAADLAKDGKEFRRSAELALQAEEGWNKESPSPNTSQLDQFLNEIVREATKEKDPDSAAFVISKISQPLRKAAALRVLGDTYGELKQEAESKQAFFDAAKQVRLIEDADPKITEWFLLTKSVLKYTPSESFEVVKELIKAVNSFTLTNDKSETGTLLRLSDDLLLCFKGLAIQDPQNARNEAMNLKRTDFRLAALCGVFSKAEESGGF